jgi:hypothetical protein
MLVESKENTKSYVQGQVSVKAEEYPVYFIGLAVTFLLYNFN